MFPAICVVFCVFTYWGNHQTEEAGSHPHFPGLCAHVYQPVSDTSSHSSLVTLDMGDRLRRLGGFPTVRTAAREDKPLADQVRLPCRGPPPGALLLFSPGLSATTEETMAEEGAPNSPLAPQLP